LFDRKIAEELLKTREETWVLTVLYYDNTASWYVTNSDEATSYLNSCYSHHGLPIEKLRRLHEV